MRLDKFLSNAKVGSRKEVKRLIKFGIVKINGEIITNVDFKVKENDIVTVNNTPITPYHNVYIIFNKPTGYTSSKSEFERNIFEFIDHPYVENLHIAGRLDKDVEGLLLITNDGIFTHKITSPKSKIEKEYIVKVDKEISDEMIQKAKDGIVLKNGTRFKPAIIKRLKDNFISITITEGKYHEIKLIVKFLGLSYKKIERIRIGKLKLEDFNLKRGEWSEIDYKTALKALE
ncbi:RNA-binding protein S4 [Thermosipho melanesiensis]|uniref:RNA-binding S4 domain protein n=2 Tax=Thermosipho melanesiensis TaxID=46541 RepID=A6LLC7_THEM4|nr:pseudouridine synthase [Thermosipho melanesiensis]ABR30728.1 RNA-binding S4 domain protein [Thermosipho melanesiensis BI429]APT73855.1 16S rRNA pseudouridylate synthase [Thermosipho melanesiensis]OOC35795.1 RNA-binding protein S4 [Thermosipho melanesiensis]OOC38297.1 RNA-binding protein S4 [Thermosipho melanesiensis]OOC38758.1 RNA-binding protein S4 [Thermosipho melanesiensis]